MSENSPESIYVCGITQEILLMPVTTDCNHSFEKAMLQRWLKEKSTCPICRKEIDKKDYPIDVELQKKVNKFLSENPTFVQNQFFSQNVILDLMKEDKIQEIYDIFQRNPEKINDGIQHGKTALHIAIELGKPELVHALLKIPGINVNARVDTKWLLLGKTPLHFAAELDDTEILALLLKNSANPNNIDSDGYTPLRIAVKAQHKKNVQLLCAVTRNINQACFEQNQTVLHAAVMSKDSDIVEELLKHPDLDPNIKDKNDKSALSIAEKNHQQKIINLLLPFANNTDMSTTESDGSETTFQMISDLGIPGLRELFRDMTISLICAHDHIKKQNWKEAADVLSTIYLENIAPEIELDMNELDSNILNKFINSDSKKRIEIFELISNYRYTSIKYMLTYLACLYLEGKDSRDFEKQISSYVKRRGSNSQKNQLQQLISKRHKLINHYLKAFGIHSLNKELCRELFPKIIIKALQNNDILLILAFLETDPKLINKPLINGKTLLHLAVEAENMTILKALVKMPWFNINIQCTKNGETALHLAAHRKKSSMTRFLLQHKANPNIVSTNGKAPSLLAIEQGDIKTIFLLLKAPRVNVAKTIFMAAQHGKFDLFEKLLASTRINLHANTLSEQRQALKKIAHHYELNCLLHCYYFIVNLLNHRDVNIDTFIDFTKLENAGLLPLLADLVRKTQTVDEHQLDLAFYHLRQINWKNPSAENIKIQDTVFKDEKEKYNTWNSLFKISFRSSFNRRYDWQGQIRTQAFKDLKDSLQNKTNKEKIEKLQWAKTQAVFSSHRSTFFLFRIGRTSTVKEIDRMIEKEGGYRIK